jgi:hypothetical protein
MNYRLALLIDAGISNKTIVLTEISYRETSTLTEARASYTRSGYVEDLATGLEFYSESPEELSKRF